MTAAALAAYFLRLGATGFGGPIALVGYMQRDLVERRGWITEQEYAQGLALAQLAPGPLAAQLAMYVGWVRGGTWGATLTGAAFIAPSFLMVLALSYAYVRLGGLPWMQHVFYGVGAAVIAVIIRSGVKLTRITLRRDALLWGLAALSAGATAWREAESVWAFVACGLVALIARAAPPAPRPGTLAALGIWVPLPAVGLLGTLFWFFAGAGMFVFGSGLAIVPFMHGGVVQHFHWLSEREFLDAVAVSMITPGPVVITVAFVGYLVAGPLGACVAAAGVFLPVYFVTVALAPSFHRWAANTQVKAFVDGVTAAATGAILGAAIVLARRAIVDATALSIGLAAFCLLTWGRRLPDAGVIVAAGVAGVALR